jgi:hypothetical protein
VSTLLSIFVSALGVSITLLLPILIDLSSTFIFFSVSIVLADSKLKVDNSYRLILFAELTTNVLLRKVLADELK